MKGRIYLNTKQLCCTSKKAPPFFTSFEVCDTHCKTTGLPYCVKLDRIMLKHDYTLKIWSFLKSFKQNSYAL